MIFGTDGVRGLVDKEISSTLAYEVGKGMAISLIKRNLNKSVVIGKDTRISSDTYMSGVISGLTDYGINVVNVGIVPTPVISFLVSRLDFGGGVMVTASHNDYTYNGIKVFNEMGEKINKICEMEIEKNINSLFVKPNIKGQIEYNENLVNKYIDYLFNYVACDLSGITVAIDCANGANYKLAPYVYKKLHCNVIEIACNNDGLNINNNCGANHVDNLVKEVKSHNGDFGIAFDGDGDRLRIVLRDGRVLSGDDILIYLALYLKEKNKLNNLMVVGTVMHNLGIEEKLLSHKIRMIRTDVGDRNVIQMIKDNRLSLGGESSGHICIYEHNPTCDALLNSLFFLKCYKENIINLENLISTISKYPSLMKNIKVDKKTKIEFDKNNKLKKQIIAIEKSNCDARVIVRPSGTEPVIRLYAESKSEITNKKIIDNLTKIIKGKNK